MRKKYVEKVYMREVTDKEFYFEEDKKFNGYIALKYVKDISKPLSAYCNGKKYVGLDKGYTILEYIPFEGNFNCRVFFDKENRPLCFYFDINNGMGKDEEGIWYDDLYLDVTMECPAITGGFNYIRLDDEGEFKKAYKEGLITDEQYKLGYETAEKIMQELRSSQNKIVNHCHFDLYRLKNLLGINNDEELEK